MYSAVVEGSLGALNRVVLNDVGISVSHDQLLLLAGDLVVVVFGQLRHSHLVGCALLLDLELAVPGLLLDRQGFLPDS